MTLELLHGIRYYTLTRTSIPKHASYKRHKVCTQYRIRLAVVILIIQWSFKQRVLLKKCAVLFSDISIAIVKRRIVTLF